MEYGALLSPGCSGYLALFYCLAARVHLALFCCMAARVPWYSLAGWLLSLNGTLTPDGCSARMALLYRLAARVFWCFLHSWLL